MQIHVSTYEGAYVPVMELKYVILADNHHSLIKPDTMPSISSARIFLWLLHHAWLHVPNKLLHVTIAVADKLFDTK